MWSYAGISVVNAIASWLGSTMAIDIKIEAKIGEKGEESDLLRTIKNFFEEKYNIKGIEIKVHSPLPPKSGLKTSSAVAVAVIEAIKMKYGLKVNTPLLASKLCLEAKISITGAFDDALASYCGGISFTNNERNEILDLRDIHDNLLAIILVRSGREGIDVYRLRNYKNLFREIFNIAINGDIIKAMRLNGIAVAEILGYETELIEKALKLGALASGITGNGPSIFAITKDGEEGPIYDLFSKKGRIIVARPARISREIK